MVVSVIGARTVLYTDLPSLIPADARVVDVLNSDTDRIDCESRTEVFTDGRKKTAATELTVWAEGSRLSFVPDRFVVTQASADEDKGH